MQEQEKSEVKVVEWIERHNARVQKQIEKANQAFSEKNIQSLSKKITDIKTKKGNERGEYTAEIIREIVDLGNLISIEKVINVTDEDKQDNACVDELKASKLQKNRGTKTFNQIYEDKSNHLEKFSRLFSQLLKSTGLTYADFSLKGMGKCFSLCIQYFAKIKDKALFDLLSALFNGHAILGSIEASGIMDGAINTLNNVSGLDKKFLVEVTDFVSKLSYFDEEDKIFTTAESITFAMFNTLMCKGYYCEVSDLIIKMLDDKNPNTNYVAYNFFPERSEIKKMVMKDSEELQLTEAMIDLKVDEITKGIEKMDVKDKLLNGLCRILYEKDPKAGKKLALALYERDPKILERSRSEAYKSNPEVWKQIETDCDIARAIKDSAKRDLSWDVAPWLFCFFIGVLVPIIHNLIYANETKINEYVNSKYNESLTENDGGSEKPPIVRSQRD